MITKYDVFLLAAGESSRMFPLSSILEKSLLPVNGRPVIRHIVDNLRKCDKIGKITVCCLTKFKKQFEHEFRDIDIEFKEFTAPMGTVNTAISFEDYHTSSKYVMIHYADCLTEIDYTDFISKIDEKYDGMIAVTNTVKHDYSEVSFTVDGVVQDFVEKPNVMNYSWSGIALIHLENLIEKYFSMRHMKPIDFAFDIFPQMIKQDKLKAYPYNGPWADMGNLNSYRKICAKYNGEK